MSGERFRHDPAYKQFFSDPRMVESLPRDFVDAAVARELDLATLERCSGSYVSDDARERHDDVVWRAGVTGPVPEFQDLQEVEAMLEENMADWWEETRLRGHAQGLAEGLAEGRAEGLAAGLTAGLKTGRSEGLSTLRLTLQDLLADRFGETAAATAESMEDITALDDMRRRASSVYRAPSLEAFLEPLEEIRSRNVQ